MISASLRCLLGMVTSLLFILSGLAPARPDAFRVNYSGKVGDLDTTLITRSALKGYLEFGAGEGSVNYLNAPAMAEDRGIRVTESRPADSCEFTDLIEVVVGNDDERESAAGTFFGTVPRIVKLSGRFVEVDGGSGGVGSGCGRSGGGGHPFLGCFSQTFLYI